MGAHEFYGTPAVIDVIASMKSRRDFEITLVVHFFFSRYEQCYAQSGSDWDEHHFYVGEATFVGRELTSVNIVHTCHTISESSCPDYDREAGLAAARAEALAKLSALPSAAK